ncbi:Dihydrofolate reductase [Mucilaginibacter gossypiicola]|uniref:Dihydrofolate reductase n=1 Tax=Mucilaginibacter gossypiicola TaxID=551995 RepID=A0A1H8D0A4_9SPHI|nr:dihydrofolate reductase family protein [Mucilaginibacter gossypiicola]SEN00652.1 Dihydrofolate reductase [Mucilaginibacter gossypiicola]
MRKVLFAMNTSIDGCYDHTFAAPDAELMYYFTDLMKETGVIVYGRKTYELMVPFWPDLAKSKDGSPEDVAFAEAMTPIPKIVLSRTLATADARIVREDPEGLIRELKQQPGQTIALSSTTLLPQMLNAGLIDELRLVVHPVLIGDGQHLFNQLEVKTNFDLAGTRQFKSGVIALHYQKK